MAPSLRPVEAYPITTRALEVLRVADVTPGMRRVTLGGPGLAAHTAPNGRPVAAFRSEGFDDEFKILLKHPDAPAPVVPVQADGVLDWPRGDPHLLLRTYTVRRWDPAAGEVDVDFVDHGSGPATMWAKRVEPGETVHIAGPKMSLGHPKGADWTLVAGDETALPAIGRWLENWPEGERAQVFIEVATEDHRQDLPVPEGVEVTWLSRDGAEAGTTTLLFDAIRGADWWGGTVFAWAAGEAGTLAPIRRWLREERGLPKEQLDVTGYWRRRPDTAAADDRAAFHELSEIMPGFALRVAATIGLAAAFDAKARTTVELAAATGAAPAGLGRLLRYLEAIGVAETADAGRWRLTNLGRELEDEYTAEPLRLDRAPARRELGGALSLLSAVRTGRGDHAAWFGAEHAEHVLNEPALLASRMDGEAEEAAYLAGALAASEPLAGLRSIEITGRAAAVFADALVKAHPALRATVVAAAQEIAVFRARHDASGRLTYKTESTVDEPSEAVLLSGALNTCDDEAAIRMLRRAAARLRPGGRVLILDELLDPALAGEHEYEDDLIEYALTGGGPRSHEDYMDLFTKAAFAAPSRRTIGWGYTLYTLEP